MKTNCETVKLECHLELHVPLQEVVNVLSTRLRKTLIAIVRDIKFCLSTCNAFEDRNVYILCIVCLSVYLSRVFFMLQYMPVSLYSLTPFHPRASLPAPTRSGQCKKTKTALWALYPNGPAHDAPQGQIIPGDFQIDPCTKHTKKASTK